MAPSENQTAGHEAEGRGSFDYLFLIVIGAAVALWLLSSDSAQREGPVPVGAAWPGTTVQGWLNASTPADEDETLAPAEAYDLNAKVAAGNVVFVDCMASWCGPCLAAMPHIVEAARDYEPLGVEFVSLTQETERDVQKLEDFLAAAEGVDWPVGLGANDFFNALQIRGIPTYVIFVNGKASWSSVGHADFTDALDRALAVRKSGQ